MGEHFAGSERVVGSSPIGSTKEILMGFILKKAYCLLIIFLLLFTSCSNNHKKNIEKKREKLSYKNSNYLIKTFPETTILIDLNTTHKGFKKVDNSDIILKSNKLGEAKLFKKVPFGTIIYVKNSQGVFYSIFTNKKVTNVNLATTLLTSYILNLSKNRAIHKQDINIAKRDIYNFFKLSIDFKEYPKIKKGFNRFLADEKFRALIDILKIKLKKDDTEIINLLTKNLIKYKSLPKAVKELTGAKYEKIVFAYIKKVENSIKKLNRSGLSKDKIAQLIKTKLYAKISKLSNREDFVILSVIKNFDITNQIELTKIADCINFNKIKGKNLNSSSVKYNLDLNGIKSCPKTIGVTIKWSQSSPNIDIKSGKIKRDLYQDKLAFIKAVISKDGSRVEKIIHMIIKAKAHKPKLADDYIQIPQGEKKLIDVLKNDIDLDGDKLKIISITAPLYGEAKIVNNKIEYISSIDYEGEEQLTYSVKDPLGAIVRANLYIDVLKTDNEQKLKKEVLKEKIKELIKNSSEIADSNESNKSSIELVSSEYSSYKKKDIINKTNKVLSNGSLDRKIERVYKKVSTAALEKRDLNASIKHISQKYTLKNRDILNLNIYQPLDEIDNFVFNRVIKFPKDGYLKVKNSKLEYKAKKDFIGSDFFEYEIVSIDNDDKRYQVSVKVNVIKEQEVKRSKKESNVTELSKTPVNEQKSPLPDKMQASSTILIKEQNITKEIIVIKQNSKDKTQSWDKNYSDTNDDKFIVANDDKYDLIELNSTKILNVLANDYSNLADTDIKIISVDKPNIGEVKIVNNGRALLYKASEIGEAYFSYTISDDLNNTAYAYVSINVVKKKSAILKFATLLDNLKDKNSTEEFLNNISAIIDGSSDRSKIIVQNIYDIFSSLKEEHLTALLNNNLYPKFDDFSIDNFVKVLKYFSSFSESEKENIPPLLLDLSQNILDLFAQDGYSFDYKSIYIGKEEAKIYSSLIDLAASYFIYMQAYNIVDSKYLQSQEELIDDNLYTYTIFDINPKEVLNDKDTLRLKEYAQDIFDNAKEIILPALKNITECSAEKLSLIDIDLAQNIDKLKKIYNSIKNDESVDLNISKNSFKINFAKFFDTQSNLSLKNLSLEFDYEENLTYSKNESIKQNKPIGYYIKDNKKIYQELHLRVSKVDANKSVISKFLTEFNGYRGKDIAKKLFGKFDLKRDFSDTVNKSKQKSLIYTINANCNLKPYKCSILSEKRVIEGKSYNSDTFKAYIKDNKCIVDISNAQSGNYQFILEISDSFQNRLKIKENIKIIDSL